MKRLFLALFLLIPIAASAQFNGCPAGFCNSATSAAGSLSLDFTGGTLPSGVTETRASVATFYNSSGVLSTASNNVARFDYNPATLGLRGLLIEPTQTNIIQPSNNFTTSPWTTNAVPVLTTGAGTSPDGTSNAMQNTASTGQFQGPQLIPLFAPATAYTCTTYYKNITGNFLLFIGDGTNVLEVTFSNNTTAVAGNATGSVQTVAPTGWFRATVNFTNSTNNFILYDVSFAGPDVGQFYGVQCSLQTANLSNSYIATTSSAATRAADAISFTIPAGIGHLTYTFDDNSTQIAAVSPGAFTVPTNLNRPWIKTIVGAP